MVCADLRHQLFSGDIPKVTGGNTRSQVQPDIGGEVRWAIPLSGSSCRLSGGNQLSSAVTTVSKKWQIRRAFACRYLFSAALSAALLTGAGGVAVRCTQIGAESQKKDRGSHPIQTSLGF